MADGNTRRKSVKNIYDGSTGLPIMINLYVIKYIYYHIDKAQCFMDKEGSGRKAKAYPIYGSRGFPVSRQRLDRINKGYAFEFTRGESNEVVETFGIDDIYFRKTEPRAFEINGISDTDWKCFYNTEYEGIYELPPQVRDRKNTVMANADRVKTKLKELVSNWEKTLGRDDPLYAVCHYYHHGERFDRPDLVRNLKEILSVLPYQDWDKEGMDSLREVQGLMKNHYQYINALIVLDNIRNRPKK